MKCVKCGHEMEGGFSFRLALAGTVKIEKMEIKKNSMQPEVCVCPNCGKVETVSYTHLTLPTIA